MNSPPTGLIASPRERRAQALCENDRRHDKHGEELRRREAAFLFASHSLPPVIMRSGQLSRRSFDTLIPRVA